MANIKAKIKNIKKISEQNLRNRQVKSQVKTALKKATLAIANHAENTKELIASAQKEINVAVSKGVIHKNNGARKMSRLDALAQKHQTDEAKHNLKETK